MSDFDQPRARRAAPAEPSDFDVFEAEPLAEPSVVQRRSNGWKSALAVIVALAVLIGGGWFVINKLASLGRDKTDYSGAGDQPVVVTIPQGADATKIGKILADKDVV